MSQPDPRPTAAAPAVARWRRGPLLAAGFLTAFGAHAIAANLGRYATSRHASLLELGVLLALYDGAEVLLKPAFGALADRIGARPVLLGGLLGFAAASAGFVLAGEQDALAAARFAQGAAAAAFARRQRVGRPVQPRRTAGPRVRQLRGLEGPGLHHRTPARRWAHHPRRLSAAVHPPGRAWPGRGRLGRDHASRRPAVARARQTVLGLARRLAQPSFLQPVLALAGATAALSAGVGFLPVRGAQAGLGPLAIGAAASLLALAAALVQPRAGRAHDRGRLPGPTGMTAGLALAAAGFVAAVALPGLPGLLLAALAVGAGTGLVTPLGFAALSSATPTSRLGHTMGAAEVGRELGDAGGPCWSARSPGSPGWDWGSACSGWRARCC